jgi:hypothetical protein
MTTWKLSSSIVFLCAFQESREIINARFLHPEVINGYVLTTMSGIFMAFRGEATV